MSTNISSLISPDILKTISSSSAIKTFGDQLKNKAKDKIVSAVSGKLDELYKKLDKLKDDKIQLELNHPTELKRLEVLYKNGEIPTAELYNEAVAAENDSYLTKQQDINNQILAIQDDIANFISDPLKKIKAERLKLKSNIKKLKTRIKGRKIKINKDRIKKLALNTLRDNRLVLHNQTIKQLLDFGLTDQDIDDGLTTLLAIYSAEGITPKEQHLLYLFLSVL